MRDHASPSVRTLREVAAQQLDGFTAEYGEPDDRDAAINRWTFHLISTGDLPDDVLAALPEVSRHDEPQDSPQEYECGCVAITRITDRDYRRHEKPFEMRLAIPCNSPSCELPHLRDEGI